MELAVVDEDEEEDEADEGGDEDEEAEEEALAGAHAVHPGVGDHLPRGHRHPVHVILAPEPDTATFYTPERNRKIAYFRVQR